MSGTQDETFGVENSGLQEDFTPNLQSGTEEEQTQEKLSPAQKMDRLLRSSNPNSMKKEIEKLRKESAKYRTASRNEAEQRAALEEKAHEIQKELDALRISNRSLKVLRALDKAGCIKSELVAKDIPSDCENLEEFIEEYKAMNDFLFKEKKQSYGGIFKPSSTKNLTPSQQMDAYIRAALGR
ncbi:MAG: hypothetical protein KHX03_06335 [Clostridium sp.]|nr:hypothetical protein [Clostridium sp.]